MKYAPRKVFIIENGEYVELAYEEFKNRKETDESYEDKLFLPVQGCLLETDRQHYQEFYQVKEHNLYLKKLDKKNGLLSIDAFDSEDDNGIDYIQDYQEDVADTYPALISDSTFTAANKAKNERRTVTDYVVTADNKVLTNTVHCAKCGGRLYHRTDKTNKHNETWYCKTDGCKKAMRTPIAELEQHITHILNRIIENPSLIEYLPQNETEPSLELRRMENELERMLSSIDTDRDKVQNLILQCATKKYSENTSTRHITERLQAEFEKSSPLVDFSSDFFGRTVSAVLLGQNDTVSLVLKNGNIIGKESNENDNANNDDAQNGQGDTAEAGMLR